MNLGHLLAVLGRRRAPAPAPIPLTAQIERAIANVDPWEELLRPTGRPETLEQALAWAQAAEGQPTPLALPPGQRLRQPLGPRNVSQIALRKLQEALRTPPMTVDRDPTLAIGSRHHAARRLADALGLLWVDEAAGRPLSAVPRMFSRDEPLYFLHEPAQGGPRVYGAQARVPMVDYDLATPADVHHVQAPDPVLDPLFGRGVQTLGDVLEHVRSRGGDTRVDLTPGGVHLWDTGRDPVRELPSFWERSGAEFEDQPASIRRFMHAVDRFPPGADTGYLDLVLRGSRGLSSVRLSPKVRAGSRADDFIYEPFLQQGVVTGAKAPYLEALDTAMTALRPRYAREGLRQTAAFHERFVDPADAARMRARYALGLALAAGAGAGAGTGATQ